MIMRLMSSLIDLFKSFRLYNLYTFQWGYINVRVYINNIVEIDRCYKLSTVYYLTSNTSYKVYASFCW